MYTVGLGGCDHGLVTSLNTDRQRRLHCINFGADAPEIFWGLGGLECFPIDRGNQYVYT